MNGCSPQRTPVGSRRGAGWRGSEHRPPADPGTSPGSSVPPPLREAAPRDETPELMERTQTETRLPREEDSDSSAPSPMREQFLSSDLEASGEESDPRPPPGKTAVWIVKRQVQKVKIYLFCRGTTAEIKGTSGRRGLHCDSRNLLEYLLPLSSSRRPRKARRRVTFTGRRSSWLCRLSSVRRRCWP